jgi:hypothetical protein
VLTPDADGRAAYRDDFASRKYLHTAHVTNTETLQWRRGDLRMRGVAGRPRMSELKWRFVSERPLSHVKVSLDCIAITLNAGVNNLAVSLDGRTPMVQKTTRGKRLNRARRFRGSLVLDLSRDDRFSGVREFWVHVEMVNMAGGDTRTSNILRQLDVEAALGP